MESDPREGRRRRRLQPARRTRSEERAWIGAVGRRAEMPELKHLRGIRVQEYYAEEWLEDAAEDGRRVHTPGIAQADRREGRAPREPKPRRANNRRNREAELATLAAWSSRPDL
jgi:hypothetical protein